MTLKNNIFYRRINYWNRIIKAYLFPTTSQLTFWHGEPEINIIEDYEAPKPYYMKFHYKANYNGHFDKNGIPILDYQGKIGMQYNPIAITQYGLGNYNLFLDNGENHNFEKFYSVAVWLIDNLELNKKKVPVWHHYFDYEYRNTLKSPWYSGLAQGLGLSVLLRAYHETKDQKFLDAHDKAWISFTKNLDDGGVLYNDTEGNIWIEEYIVSPPTHILNGFIWALWGVYDNWKLNNSNSAKVLFEKCIKTLKYNLIKYDSGYWSLYEQSDTFLPMISSPFYHKLHIVQLKILYNLTKENFFDELARKWELYNHSILKRNKALIKKTLFKIFYY